MIYCQYAQSGPICKAMENDFAAANIRFLQEKGSVRRQVREEGEDHEGSL